MTAEDYEVFLKGETRRCVERQEALGLDVLVHGEFERNDMVEHFGDQLAGFAVTENGWVQSYGSRCVKPPVLFGDVARPAAMTVAWWTFAQALTTRPMKGMPEASRSKMEVQADFARVGYPNEIGPEVYDIHSPRVPSRDEMLALLDRARQVLPEMRVWVNPDFGLKTRGWPEVETALANMVEAARMARRRFNGAAHG